MSQIFENVSRSLIFEGGKKDREKKATCFGQTRHSNLNFACQNDLNTFRLDSAGSHSI